MQKNNQHYAYATAPKMHKTDRCAAHCMAETITPGEVVCMWVDQYMMMQDCHDDSTCMRQLLRSVISSQVRAIYQIRNSPCVLHVMLKHPQGEMLNPPQLNVI
jgi:hypothetical protein